MLFEKTYRFAFIIYSIFGMSPFNLLYQKSWNSREKFKKSILIAEGIWMIGTITFYIYFFIYTLKPEIENTVFSNIDIFGASGLAFWIIFSCIHFIITIESIYKRSIHVEFLNNLYEIDGIFADKLSL